MKVHQTAFWNS